MSNYDLMPSDLAENPTARIAITLVVDTSGSMDGEPIEELAEGITIFQKSLHDDDIAKYAAEVCIIGFGSNVNEIQDFKTVHDNYYIPKLSASGRTAMGAAVTRAIEKLEERKNQYKSMGVDYYQPWLVLMSDGIPTDDYKGIASKVRSMVEEKRLTVFPIGIGSQAQLDILSEFSADDRPALRLKGLNFKDFFTWLSRSVSMVSRSTPGENVKLDMDAIKGWGEL